MRAVEVAGNPGMTVGELARRLGGELCGDPSKVIRCVATLEHAGPDALAWVGSPDFLPRMAKSNAGVVLIAQGYQAPPGQSVIRVANPDVALCQVLAMLAPPSNIVEPGIDPKATVSRSAAVEGTAIAAHVFVGPHVVIGAGTQLHPGVYVGSYTHIGRDCVLWPNVVVRERVTIGDRVTIHPNATVGADGFGYVQSDGHHHKIPQIGTVVIEDDVEIGANTAIDRARSGTTRIGRGSKIDNLVQIGHNVDVGQDCIIVAQVGIAGSASLGHHVMVAGQVGIGDHRHLGGGSRVATKSVVLTNVPDGQVFRGIPAVENMKFLRRQASFAKLPDLIDRLRDLQRRVQRLEANRDDSNT